MENQFLDNNSDTDNYEKYGPGSGAPVNNAQRQDEESGAPLEVPGVKKEIVFQFYNQDPEAGRVKQLYGEVSRKFRPVHLALLGVMFLEVVALSFLDHSAFKYMWLVLALFLAMLFVLTFIIAPQRRRKLYKEQIAAGEMNYLYTFFNDCVVLKNNSAEITLKYDDAQFYAENNEAMVVGFQFSKHFVIDKNNCTEEQLDFIRNFVPKSNMDVTRKKTRAKMIRKIVIAIVCVLWLGVFIYRDINYYPDRTKYANTTYSSFYDCVGQGSIKDVVIIDDKYVEYTFTGNSTDERYYTVYKGDMKLLIDYLEANNTNWEYK